MGSIVEGFTTGSLVDNLVELTSALARYADLITPWAWMVAGRMLADVDQRDKRAWIEHGREMGRLMRQELEDAPTGHATAQLLQEQVALITSLPRKAAERVHLLTTEALINGGVRAKEIAAEIARTSQVTQARARLIARTEVARTASTLTEARAKFIGSEGYIWRTAGDSDVRPATSLSPRQRAGFIGSHRKLEGKFIRWDDPPVSGQNGERAHAGQIYNCRCYPEPVIPDSLGTTQRGRRSA